MAVQNSAILNIHHTVIGIDWHNYWLPGSPVPAPAPLPHPWILTLGGINVMQTVKATGTTYNPEILHETFSDGFHIIQRGSDIGPLTIHIFPNLLLPLILLASGSVSEFGAFTVKINKAPVATAFPAKYGTLNLNCQGPGTPPVPLPTGIVLALPSTTFAGMHAGDIVASLAAMGADMLMAWVFNKMGSAFLSRLGISRFLARTVGLRILRLTASTVGRFLPPRYLPVLVLKLPAVFLGMIGIGSPVGYSHRYSLANPYQTGRDAGADALAGLLNPSSGADM